MTEKEFACDEMPALASGENNLNDVRVGHAYKGAQSQSTYLDSFVPFLLSVHGELIWRSQTPVTEDVLKPRRLVHGIR